MQDIYDKVYPVGCLYWSSKATDPSKLFGGTWERIEGKFLYAMGSSDTVDATGGKSSVTLSEANLPSHTHDFTPTGTVSNHRNSISHTHEFSGTTGGGGSHQHAMYVRGAGGIDCVYGGRSDWSAIGTAWTESSGWHTHSFSGTTGGPNTSDSGWAKNGSTENMQTTGSGGDLDTSYAGSGTAFSIMPPHINKYCWERIEDPV